MLFTFCIYFSILNFNTLGSNCLVHSSYTFCNFPNFKIFNLKFWIKGITYKKYIYCRMTELLIKSEFSKCTFNQS